MPSMYRRLMDARTVSASTKQAVAEAMDVGSFSRLELQCRVLKGGTAGNLYLEHAAVNEEAAYVALTGASWPMDTAANLATTVTDFLRFIRWAGDSAVAGAPLAQLDVVAKER